MVYRFLKELLSKEEFKDGELQQETVLFSILISSMSIVFCIMKMESC
jgi:hypothetical protein